MVCLLFYLWHLFCFRICIDAVYNASMRLTLLSGVSVWTNSPAHKICQNTQDLKSFHAAVTAAEKSAASGLAAAEKWLTVPCASSLSIRSAWRRMVEHEKGKTKPFKCRVHRGGFVALAFFEFRFTVKKFIVTFFYKYMNFQIVFLVFSFFWWGGTSPERFETISSSIIECKRKGD